MSVAPRTRFDPPFAAEAPWPLPALQECAFYHCLDFPDGESVGDANWDIRGRFAQYIGHHPVAGKTVLDVGTASGYVAFAAEEAGASRVTALDAPDAGEFERIPFRGSAFTERHGEWVGHTDQYLTALKKSFWYSWHKKKSGVEAVYAPVSALRAWDRTFDVVIAGAIVEHISDPVPFIASLARLAREAVIIAFTPHLPTEDQVMTTMNDWSNPVYDYSWWMLSLGLYRRVFANLGFAITTVPAVARCNEYDFPLDVTRPTIVAVRNA